MLEIDMVAPPLDIKFPSVKELPTEDGIPLESPWHRAEINLLLESIDNHWQERDDYYAGGNMFIYFSEAQVRRRDYRGPDFYVVRNVDRTKERGAWIVWEEGGRYPDIIIELLSPSTAEMDKTVKKTLYEHTFHTPEYFCYDPQDHTLVGWRLQGVHYQPIEPDRHNRLWSEVLQLWLGSWQGTFGRVSAIWLRFFDEPSGNVIPTIAEAEAARAEAEAVRAEQEAIRAEQEAARAEQEAAARLAAEAEIERLRQELARLKGQEK
jgi:Uma2 family endonuclease